MCRKMIFPACLILALGVINAADGSLVGWWQFDETSGTVAHDSSGYGNDGIIYGKPPWGGDAWEFDGIDDYIDCGDGPSLNITGEVTVTAWIRLNEPVTDRKIAGNQDGITGGYKFGVYSDLLEFEIRTANNAAFLNRNVGGGMILEPGVYHHVAGVYSEGNYIRTYVNGVLDRELSTTAVLGTSTGSLKIGREPFNNLYFWLGSMDDVRVYNRALTQQEIKDIIENPFASDPDPADGAIYESTWANLSWTPGAHAVSHDVYIGDNFDDVNDGAAAAFQGNHTSSSVIVGFAGFPYPEGLVPGTTYYWRIDEVNDANANSPWRGHVWNFTVLPRTAYDPYPTKGASSVGLDVTLSWNPGMGAFLHYVYFGDNFDDVNNATGGVSQGITTYAPGSLELGKTYYWRVDEFDGIAIHRGDVWSFTVAIGHWEKLNGPYGCYVGGIAVDPCNPAIVYMATNIDGTYKSFDGGETWAPMNNGIPSHAMGGWSVAIDPSNPLNLYYGAWDAGPCVSHDGGKSWEYKHLSDCTCTLDIAISRSNPYIVYVADQQCVWKSVDCGGNWELQGEENGFPVNSNHYAVAVDPHDPNLAYAAGGDVNFCWFWKTTTGGRTWDKKNLGLDPTKFIWAIVLHPTSNDVIYIATDHGVYKTIDGAESWIPMNQGLTNIFTRDMAIDPVNPDILYVATWNGLFRSLDAGLNWERISDDSRSQCIKTIALDTSDSRVVYAGIWGGVLKSMDNGDSWTFQDEGLIQDLNVARYSLAVDPKDPNVIYVGTLGGGVAKSTDAGKSFEYTNKGLEIGYCQGIYLSPHDSQTLFCYTRGGHFVYKTTDGGSRWFVSNVGLPQHYFYSMCGSFDPHNPDAFYLGTYADGAYKTTDGGASWFALDVGQDDLIVRAIAPDPINRGTVYAATYAGVLKSMDFGRSWFPSSRGMSDLTIWSVAIAPSEPLILYAGGKSSGVFTSGDGGESWIPCGSEIQGKMVRNILVDPINPLTLYVGTYFNGMFVSTNGGQSWQAYNDGLSSMWVKDINFDNPHSPSCLYVGTGNGVYRRTAYPFTEMSTD